MNQLPKVSILVVTYLKENQRYLDLCIKSIKNLNYPKEDLDILILSTGDYEPETHGYRSVHTSKHMHFPEGANYGVKLLEPSKYILLLNDDVILTRDSLIALVTATGDMDCVMGPISNCDSGFKHMLSHMGYDDGEFKPFPKRFYRYEDIEHISDKMMNTSIHTGPGLWFQQWIAFYATLFPRKTWDRIGGLDPNFLTGQDDVDMCLRARQLGIPVFINQQALVWHAGGVSADAALTDPIRQKNIEYFTKKWGISPFFFH